MESFKKIIGINFGIFVFYSLLFIVAMTNATGYDGIGVLLVWAITVALQFGICIITGIVFIAQNKSELGKAFLLSAGIILLIGFSGCFAGMAYG